MVFISRLLCLLVLTSCALAQNQPDAPKAATPATPKYPNIVLITLDTTRADRMDFLGSKRGLTPNLDLLARDSAVFTRAYSQAPLTPTSHSTIFTGTYPQYHQVLIFPIPLAKDLPYLPAILKDHGYSTAAFVGSIAVDYQWGTPGFERGYDTYDAGFRWEGYTPETRFQTVERRGGEVVARALDWLSKHRQGPFFLWVHLFDPHDPYDPPEPFRTRYAKALYDGEIAYVDSVMGKFFKQLKASGLYDDTIVALTADHGESLGAHGENTHGIFIYDETIHVPLVIKLPRDSTTGKLTAKRIDDRVELADIMPTVLESIGIPVPEKVQGQSLLGFIKPGTPEGDVAAKAWQDRGAYSQSDYEHLAFSWSALQSLRSGKYLYIQAPRRELYEDGIDAAAQHNLAPLSPAVADTLSAKLKDFIQTTTNTQETPKTRLEERQVKKLAVLGYMASRGESKLAAPGEEGADPKDKIQIANTIIRINDFLQNFRCEKAEAEIRKALVISPNISLLHFFLGGCYLEKKDYPKAVAELRTAVKLDPGFTQAEMNLGRALMESGDSEAATTAFEHVAKSEPNIVDAHIFLTVLYQKADRPQDVVKESQAVLKLIPDNFGATMNLGHAMAKLGDLAGAIPLLQKAATLLPDRPGPHMYLSEVYTKMGREEDAKREREEAERLGAVPKNPAEVPLGGGESKPDQP
jgi:arylsulfatase A-like enzyme/Flp pilus assembly protein TadD